MVIENTNNGLIVEYALSINYELISTIMGFGNNCKVLSPNTLTNKIIEIVDKMKAQY